MVFIKRIAMCAVQCHYPNITAAYLFLISEVLQARPQLKQMIIMTDHEQHMTLSHQQSEDTNNNGGGGGGDGIGSIMSDSDGFWLGGYDANKRDPQYACYHPPSTTLEEAPAPSTTPPAPPMTIISLPEIQLLSHHVHPSVRAFAIALLTPPEHGIAYDGDPLEEFGLMAFLNRFAYKQPKHKVLENLKQIQALNLIPINLQISEELTNLSTTQDQQQPLIAPEKHFFYKYFQERETLKKIGKSKRGGKQKKCRGESDDSNSDDEDDSEDEDGEDDDDYALNKKLKQKKKSKKVQEDDEDEMDAFADKLAEDLMRSDAAGRGEVCDDDDDDDDDMDDDDDGDGDDHEELDKHFKEMNENDDGYDDEDDDDDDDVNFDDHADDDDIDDDDEIDDEDGENSIVVEEFGDEASDDGDDDALRKEIEKFQKKYMSQSKVSTHNNNHDDEDEFDDFEDFKKSQTQKKVNTKSKLASKSKKQLKKQIDDDDDIPELEIYQDSDDDNDNKKQSKKKQNKRGKRPVEELSHDEDGDYGDRNDASNDDFADAAMYEDQMEENVQRFSGKDNGTKQLNSLKKDKIRKDNNKFRKRRKI
jgi:hypothetical protein